MLDIVAQDYQGTLEDLKYAVINYPTETDGRMIVSGFYGGEDIAWKAACDAAKADAEMYEDEYGTGGYGPDTHVTQYKEKGLVELEECEMSASTNYQVVPITCDIPNDINEERFFVIVMRSGLRVDVVAIASNEKDAKSLLSKNTVQKRIEFGLLPYGYEKVGDEGIHMKYGFSCIHETDTNPYVRFEIVKLERRK